MLAEGLHAHGAEVIQGAPCAHPLSSRWSGAVRVSPYLHNTAGEVDRFLDIADDSVRYRLL